MENKNNDKIILYHFPKKGNVQSGYCNKLEFFLKFSGVEFIERETFPYTSPKGKLPYIIYNNEIISDSSLIIKYLIKNKIVKNIDINITEKDKSISLSFQRIIEEHLYIGVIYERWLTEEGWKIQKPLLLDDIPFILKPILPLIMKRKINNVVYYQGLGVHSKDEIFNLMEENIIALANYIKDKKYFLGYEKPTIIDSIVAGFLYSILYWPSNPTITKIVKKYDNLINYVNNIRNEFF